MKTTKTITMRWPSGSLFPSKWWITLQIPAILFAFAARADDFFLSIHFSITYGQMCLLLSLSALSAIVLFSSYLSYAISFAYRYDPVIACVFSSNGTFSLLFRHLCPWRLSARSFFESSHISSQLIMLFFLISCDCFKNCCRYRPPEVHRGVYL